MSRITSSFARFSLTMLRHSLAATHRTTSSSALAQVSGSESRSIAGALAQPSERAPAYITTEPSLTVGLVHRSLTQRLGHYRLFVARLLSWRAYKIFHW